MKFQWTDKDVVEIGKVMDIYINDSDAYQILKNVSKAHGNISKANIINEIKNYYDQKLVVIFNEIKKYYY